MYEAELVSQMLANFLYIVYCIASSILVEEFGVALSDECNSAIQWIFRLHRQAAYYLGLAQERENILF